MLSNPKKNASFLKALLWGYQDNHITYRNSQLLCLYHQHTESTMEEFPIWAFRTDNAKIHIQTENSQAVPQCYQPSPRQDVPCLTRKNTRAPNLCFRWRINIQKLTNSSFLVNVTRHDTNFTFSRLRKEWEKSDGTFKPPLATVQPWTKGRGDLHWWLRGSWGPPAGSCSAAAAGVWRAPCPAGGCPQWCKPPGASLHRWPRWWQQQQTGEGRRWQWLKHLFVLWPARGTTKNALRV